MSHFSKMIASVTCALTISTMMGCATFNGTVGKKLPKATLNDPVMKIVCLWQQATGNDPDGRPCKGFSGQVLFFSRTEKTVQVEGDVRIYLFDDQGTEEEQAKPLHDYNFENRAWSIHLAETSLGPTYGVFVPYTRHGTTDANCSLRVRLKPKFGPTVFSDFSNLPLNGNKKPVMGDDAKPTTKEDNELQTAKEMTDSLRRTTTISMGPGTKTTESRNATMANASPNQIQQTLHESPSGSANDTNDAERIRQLETMVQLLMQQKSTIVTPSPPESQPHRIPHPMESEDEVADSSEHPKATRRSKPSRGDDDEAAFDQMLRSSQRRKAHPLDEQERPSTRSRSSRANELVQDPTVEDPFEADLESNNLPRYSLQDQRYRRSAR